MYSCMKQLIHTHLALLPCGWLNVLRVLNNTEVNWTCCPQLFAQKPLLALPCYTLILRQYTKPLLALPCYTLILRQYTKLA